MVQSKKKKAHATEILYLLLNEALRDQEISTFIEQVLQENAVAYRYSQKTFTNSILWLQAKPYTHPTTGEHSYIYENEFALIYYCK